MDHATAAFTQAPATKMPRNCPPPSTRRGAGSLILSNMDRRQFLQTAVMGTAGAAIGAGLADASRRLRVTWHSVPMRLETDRQLLVAHLTDLHLGRATPTWLAHHAARRAAQMHPDLTVLTGDYLNHSLGYLDRLHALLPLLPRPCVATLGNHDHWSGAGVIRRVLRQHGVTVLSNESARIETRAGPLTVVGVDDGRTRHDDVPRAFARVADPARALVLAHYPRTAGKIERHGGRVILSGHTHGGQIHVPVLTPALGRLGGNRYLAGWYQVGAARLYVNAGIGASVIGLRVGRRAAPELCLLRLRPRARRA